MKLKLAAAMVAVSVAIPCAQAQDREHERLSLGDENYLCTLQGSVWIDSSLGPNVETEDSSNPYLVGVAWEVWVIDFPEGDPRGEEGGEIRHYFPATRRLRSTYPMTQNSEKTIIGGYEFSDGPGGYYVLLRRDVLKYRTRHDFGGRTGSFISSDEFGTCEKVESLDDLPPTVAMRAGVPEDAAEKYIDDWIEKSNAEHLKHCLETFEDPKMCHFDRD